jgi:hypothetical protein
MSAASLTMPSATAVMASSLRVRPLRSLHCLWQPHHPPRCTARSRWSHHPSVWHPSLLGDPAQSCRVHPAGIEPATPSLPSMRGWFTTPCSTPRCRTTAQARAAVERLAARRREATCGAVSGKALASQTQSPTGRPTLSSLLALGRPARPAGPPRPPGASQPRAAPAPAHRSPPTQQRRLPASASRSRSTSSSPPRPSAAQRSNNRPVHSRMALGRPGVIDASGCCRVLLAGRTGLLLADS